MELDWIHGPLAEGLRCYRAGEFFAAHEHWEAVWLTAPEPEKNFLQGLIQIAAAFHHLGRANLAGARTLLRAALGRIEPSPNPFRGIAVRPLCADIQQCLKALDEQETPTLAVPRIRLASEA